MGRPHLLAVQDEAGIRQRAAIAAIALAARHVATLAAGLAATLGTRRCTVPGKAQQFQTNDGWHAT